MRLSLSKSGSSVSPTTALAVAVVAIIVALAGFAIPLIAPTSTSSEQVASLQSQVSRLQQQISSLPVVDEKPTNRIILLEWISTGDAGQDRFNPNYITINQGDTVIITFISNDTTDAHTFQVLLPTGQFVLNETLPGQINHLTGDIFVGPPDGCMKDGSPVRCNTTGTPGNETSSGSFTVNVPGVYRYFCKYHQVDGMFGFLTVLPNKGYTPP